MSRPWMALYVGDYLADTAHLSAAEHGAYLLLIMHYWRTGGLPDDDGALSRIARMKAGEWRKTRPIIESFFQPGWKHKRIEIEIAEAAKISEAGRKGGLASAEARRNGKATTVERSFQDRSNDQSTNGQASQSHSQRKEEDAPDGATTGKVYAFESGVIRLNQRDFDLWKASFTNLDVGAELLAMTEWAGQQRSWFNAVKGALAKKNQQAKERKAQQIEPRWNGIEGVL